MALFTHVILQEPKHGSIDSSDTPRECEFVGPYRAVDVRVAQVQGVGDGSPDHAARRLPRAEADPRHAMTCVQQGGSVLHIFWRGCGGTAGGHSEGTRTRCGPRGGGAADGGRER